MNVETGFSNCKVWDLQFSIHFLIWTVFWQHDCITAQEFVRWFKHEIYNVSLWIALPYVKDEKAEHKVNAKWHEKIICYDMATLWRRRLVCITISLDRLLSERLSTWLFDASWWSSRICDLESYMRKLPWLLLSLELHNIHGCVVLMK